MLAALRVKIRDGGSVQNKAVHLALGIRADGLKEMLGLWIETNEGAKFWLQVNAGATHMNAALTTSYFRQLGLILLAEEVDWQTALRTARAL